MNREDNPIDKEFPLNENIHLEYCQRVIEQFPDMVLAHQAGKSSFHQEGKSILEFLVGQAMKLCAGSCNPKSINSTLARLLEERDAARPTVYFYSSRDAHGYMSNFARYAVMVDGKKYRTSEHYYQSKKYEGTYWETKVRNADGPMKAAQIGRDKRGPLRKDWNSVRDDVMRKVVEAKFRQHADLAERLLATGNAKLIERTTDDTYWGCGNSGTGKNMLGVILMEIRTMLRAEKADQIRADIMKMPDKPDPIC